MGGNPEWDLVANYVLSGNSVLVLGPNLPHTCPAISGGHLPDHYAFLKECCAHFGLDAANFASDQEIVDYLTRSKANETSTRDYVRMRFRAKRATKSIAAIPHFVWRRIYSYSLSDAVELAYQHAAGATQKPIVVVRALLVAFSNFQIPIIVHHSNTGHARAFKTIVNRRFLSEVLGVNLALQIYRDFEKTFERDGFFWQQYGLCLSQAKEYEPAIDTLRHALAIHDHFMIRHSLGATCLSACIHLGPKGLLKNEFTPLREEGRRLLRDLHAEVGFRDDVSISALVELDIELSKRYDAADAFRALGEAYHRELAFYVRDHPEMDDAKRAYEKLNDMLIRASAIGEPNYEALVDVDPS
jgi:tetratricopeptide (TPR) repeat protein